MQFTIKPGYLGTCSRCMNKEATTETYTTFLEPLPAFVKDGVEIFPEVKGVIDYSCDDCAVKE